MRGLLDVNVLIALLDAQHLHHTTARGWLLANAARGWASCPFTQNGCVRIMSHPGYPRSLPPSAVMERLLLATNHPSHEFWPADVTLLDRGVANPSRIHGPRQVADVYLLALAVRHGGRFVTLDRSVPLSAVPGANRSHLIAI